MKKGMLACWLGLVTGLLVTAAEKTISRADYVDGLQEFWMAQCIANWTGLITEMDREEAPFYTDEDWGQPDQPNRWGRAGHHPVIKFFVVREGEAWGADDDTDLEYLYQYRKRATWTW